jgi:hypothetical protein
MDYGRLFNTSWQLTWRHKFLWFFGFLTALSAATSSFLRLAWGPDLFALDDATMEQWLAQPDLLMTEIDQLLPIVAAWLVGGSIILLLLSLLGWLIVIFAQGAIISTAVAHDTSQPLTFSRASQRSMGLIGRFIAIDTLVYFPLFLALLLIMLLVAAALIGTIFTAFQDSASTATIITPLLVGLLCALPILCLLTPLSLLTAAFRALAFRDTAVFNNGVRAAVRHTWTVLKANLGHIIVVGILLWGLQAALDIGLRTAALFVYAVISAPGLFALNHAASLTTAQLIFQLLSFFFEATVLLIQAIAHAFTAVFWTLAYKELSNPITDYGSPITDNQP